MSPHVTKIINRRATRKKAMGELLRFRQLTRDLDGKHRPYMDDIAEAYHTFNGRLWVLARTSSTITGMSSWVAGRVLS
jgi:hypothetical protein